MLRVALRSVLARKLRLLLTSIAVVLGVAFVSGAFVLTDSLRGSFDALFEEAAKGLDVQVQNREHKELSLNPQTASSVDLARLGIPPALVETVRGVDGVARAEGTVFELGAQPLDEDGEPIGQPGPPRFAASWVEGADDLSVLSISEGQAPGRDEVMLDEWTFEQADFELGDEITYLIQGGRKVEKFTVSGVIRFGEAESLNGATISAFHMETVQDLLDMGDRYTTIEVQAEDDLSPEQLRDRIRQAVPEEYDVITAAEFTQEQTEAIDDQFLNMLENVVLGFAAIAVFVGAFTIFNTFTIIVGQRTQEFGLLRTIGAGRRQVLGVVVIEAIVVGIVASIIGILAGFGVAAGLRTLIGSFGGELPAASYTLAPSSMAWAFGVGIGVTLLAAVVPAVRASRLSPLEAMRAVAGTEKVGWRWPLVGAIIAAAGTAVVAVGIFGDQEKTSTVLSLLGGGFATVLIGLAIFSRVLIAPVSRVVGFLLTLGPKGRIARGNIQRKRARAATTASALMIGLSLAALALVFYASLDRTVDSELDRTIGAEINLFPSGAGAGAVAQSIPAEALEVARSVDGIDLVAGQYTVDSVRGDTYEVEAGDRRDFVVAFDEGMVGEDAMVRANVLEGDLDIRPGTLVASEDLAEEASLSVGESVELAFPTGEARSFELIGIYESSAGIGSGWLIDLDEFRELAPPARVAAAGAMARVEEGADASEVADAIEAAFEDRWDFVEVRDTEELREEFRTLLQPVLGGILGMLSLSLVVALFGIGNAMALNVFERTREIGLLRAVGATRGQIRGIVRRESVLVAFYGALLGAGVGVGAAALIVAELESEGFVFAIDWLPLSAVLVVGIAAGVLAAWLPGRRAAKTNVLAAISHE